jgi:predicted SprT family Zn-dependent metalloprotease
MGLEDFNGSGGNDYKQYGHHEYNEKLENWMEEFQDRFPIELQIEFVEVSTQMSKHAAKAYQRDSDTYYIRVSETYIDRSSDRPIKFTLLHEMVHIYFWQKGYKKTNHDKYFRWVAGRVGADMTRITIDNEKWKDCIEPFLGENDI